MGVIIPYAHCSFLQVVLEWVLVVYLLTFGALGFLHKRSMNKHVDLGGFFVFDIFILNELRHQRLMPVVLIS